MKTRYFDVRSKTGVVIHANMPQQSAIELFQILRHDGFVMRYAGYRVK